MKKSVFISAVLVITSLLCVQTNACPINYSFSVTASNELGTETKTFTGTADTGSDSLTLNPLGDGSLSLLDCTIKNLTIGINTDPQVNMGISVGAGPHTTSFTIRSAVVTFAPLIDTRAYANVWAELTDNNLDEATVTGLFDGGKIYRAIYNDSITFANIIGTFSTEDGYAYAEESFPTSGPQTIAGEVSSIKSEFQFTLTAHDSISCGSTFVVIPEPATIGILSIGVLSLLRRKK